MFVTNCSCLVDDVQKIFNVYWDMGKPNATIPPSWPKDYSTRINAANPVLVNFNNDYNMNTYFSVSTNNLSSICKIGFQTNIFFLLKSSPPPMSPEGRSQDIDAIVNVIENADKFIHISVMDFIPMSLYGPKAK